MKKILACVGTRPNFIKITQLRKAFSAFPELDFKLLHTGQHYDYKMTEVFFEELNIGAPDFRLTIKDGNPMNRITGIITEFDKFLEEYQPDLVMVPGDVDSTFACAFAAARRNIPLAHIESGLRSFDPSMPEEINRILVDDISDLLFVSEPAGMKNLKKEGKPDGKIKFVGNTMIDTLVAFMKKIDSSDVRSRLNIETDSFVVVTLHRPSNVDVESQLKKVVLILQGLSKLQKVVFPIHPRTLNNLEKFNLKKEIESPQIILTDALGYLDFMNLVKNASCIITDSGGVQEETTYLKIPCLTLRENTERPVTIDLGTNELVKLIPEIILKKVGDILQGKNKKGTIPEFWDGKTSERIASEVNSWLLKK